MPVESRAPNLTLSLPLDPHAPRAARYSVAQVDRPSPDLRDAVVLLTSELVSRAVEQSGPRSAGSVELLAWMPADVVRVEVRAPRELLDPPEQPDWTQYDLLLLDQVADRWSIDTSEGEGCMWFEIDRRVTAPVHA